MQVKDYSDTLSCASLLQVKLAGSAEYYIKSCKICCCTERSQGFISKAFELVKKLFTTVVYSDDSEAKEEEDMKEKLLSYDNINGLFAVYI